jgi:hypothetical protein
MNTNINSKRRTRGPVTSAAALVAVLSATALSFSTAPGAAEGSEALVAASPIVDMPDPILITPMEVPRDGSGTEAKTPPRGKLEPIFRGKPPAPAVGTGGLVRDFPAIVPAFPSSTVSTSTVTASGSIFQSTFDASTRATCAKVEEFYQLRLAKAGLAATPLDSTASTDSVSFTRGGDSVTLTLTPASGGSCSYSIFAVLTTAS